MKYNFMILLLLLSLSFQAFAEESSYRVSGIIKDGLRVITMDMNKNSFQLYVYRGDYIVLHFKEESLQIEIPELNINEELPKNPDDKPYIKMKKSGSFVFTLGDKKGIIHVLDYKEKNYKELTAKQASDLISSINPLLIDVRTPGEYRSGHIKNSGLIPVQILSANLSKLEKYKDEPILVYCRTGNRSTVAAKILIDAGFTRIYNLRYGIVEWIDKGYLIE